MGRLGILPQLEIQTCESLLSGLPPGTPGTAFTPEECARAQTIASARRRAQFLAGRCLAKRMLSLALGGAPSDWQISADATAKPQLVGHGVQLSIAHSGPYVACSIADQAVGIDIERLARVRPVADMATLVCSDQEQCDLQQWPPETATLRFMQWWTRKEARLKQQALPFGFDELRAIQTTATDPTHADVATWCFDEPKLVLSLAAQGLHQLSVRWPDHWRTPAVEWHSYV